jgi:hypothetical protein
VDALIATNDARSLPRKPTGRPPNIATDCFLLECCFAWLELTARWPSAGNASAPPPPAMRFIATCAGAALLALKVEQTEPAILDMARRELLPLTFSKVGASGNLPHARLRARLSRLKRPRAI